VGETLLGAAGLAVFLTVAWAGGSLINTMSFRRRARILEPMARLLGAPVRGDSDTLIIKGNYLGRRVEIAHSPNTIDSMYSDRTVSKVFEVTVPDVPGSRDWRVALKRGFKLSRDWRIECDAEYVRQQLASRNVIAELEAARIDGWLAYDAAQRHLHARTDGVPPDTVRARQQLELLMRFAAANEHLTTPPR
jgi:hypothetical protein